MVVSICVIVTPGLDVERRKDDTGQTWINTVVNLISEKLQRGPGATSSLANVRLQT
jgi:hypothetical protein